MTQSGKFGPNVKCKHTMAPEYRWYDLLLKVRLISLVTAPVSEAILAPFGTI